MSQGIPNKRVNVRMTGTLLRASVEVDLGFHLLDDTTLNVEYRNRSMWLTDPTDNSSDYQRITVSDTWYHTVDWKHLLAADLAGYPEAIGDVERLEKALNYLSMPELGLSEMISLINKRQILLPIGERRVLQSKPLYYLTTHTGKSLPASWSTNTVNNTTWI